MLDLDYYKMHSLHLGIMYLAQEIERAKNKSLPLDHDKILSLLEKMDKEYEEMLTEFMPKGHGKDCKCRCSCMGESDSCGCEEIPPERRSCFYWSCC